jgi:hypothetical protein
MTNPRRLAILALLLVSGCCTPSWPEQAAQIRYLNGQVEKYRQLCDVYQERRAMAERERDRCLERERDE